MPAAWLRWKWQKKAQGQLSLEDLALPLFEETLKLSKAELGTDHPDTLISMGHLAEGYQDAEKLDMALPLFAGVSQWGIGGNDWPTTTGTTLPASCGRSPRRV